MPAAITSTTAKMVEDGTPLQGPQYLNPNGGTPQFEFLQGANGAAYSTILDASGNVLFSTANRGQTQTASEGATGAAAPTIARLAGYEDANGNLQPRGGPDKITHQSIAWVSGGAFSAASTTYKFTYQILNPKAHRRFFMFRNGLNANTGAVNMIILDSMNGTLTFAGDTVDPGGTGLTTYFVNTNYNQMFTIASELGANNVGVPVANVATSTGFSWADAPGDTIHVEIATGTTAPTGGTFDFWVREVGVVV